MEPKSPRVCDDDEQISVTRTSSLPGSRSSSLSRCHSRSNPAVSETNSETPEVLNLHMNSVKLTDDEVARENPSPKSKESEDQYQSTEKPTLKPSKHLSVSSLLDERKPVINISENGYNMPLDYIHKDKHLGAPHLQNTLVPLVYLPQYNNVYNSWIYLNEVRKTFPYTSSFGPYTERKTS